MQWRSVVSESAEIDPTAANLLDALERIRPIRELNPGPRALGRWLLESSQDGAIGDDTVVWLHRLLLTKAA
jgi:hypothetical protein